MCLLIVVPAGKAPDMDVLEGAHIYNGDGCGIAASVDGKLIIEKGMWDYDLLVSKVEKYKGHAAIVHLRMATHGHKIPKLCHPFRLPGGWAMGHNGVIPLAEIKQGLNYSDCVDESDTSLFAKYILAPELKSRPRALEDPVFCATIGRITWGSRLAFQHADGRQFIVHEDFGTWDDGCWYSTDVEHYRWSKADVFDLHRSDGPAGFPRTKFTGRWWENDRQLMIVDCDMCGQNFPENEILNFYGNSLCRKCYASCV